MARSYSKKGHPTVCETFNGKQEAEDWVREIEQQISLEKYNFSRNHKNTLSQLVDKYIDDGAI